MARIIFLKTKEPIKIELSIGDFSPETSVYIHYEGKQYLYAWLNADVSHINMDALKTWIEETYSGLSFLSSQYVPSEIKASSFQ